MRKYAVSIIAVLILLVSVVGPDRGEAAVSVEELKKQLKQLQQEMKQAQANRDFANSQIKKIGQEKQATRAELEKLNAELAELNAQIVTKENEIGFKEMELEEIERQIAEVSQRIVERDELLKNRLRLSYMKGSVSYLEVLMNSTSFSDFLHRFGAMKALVGQDKQMLEANRRDKQMREEHYAQEMNLLGELNAAYEELLALEADVAKQRDQKTVLIAQLEAQEEEYSHVSEEEERKLIAAVAAIKKKQEEIERAEIMNSDGVLRYPLEQKYRVSSWFGTRVDPITGKKGAHHNGIDIAAPKGTKIVAAADGKVIQAGWFGGFGNTVIINHGKMKNGKELWTLYAHASAVHVKNGQKVKKGDHIASVGTTGRSTGNHLHFTVYEDEVAVDPKNYINF